MRLALWTAQAITVSPITYTPAIKCTPGPIGFSIFVNTWGTAANLVVAVDFGVSGTNGAVPDTSDATLWWTPALHSGTLDNSITIPSSVSSRIYVDTSYRSIGTTLGNTGWNGQCPQGFNYMRVKANAGTNPITSATIYVHFSKGTGIV